MGESHARWARAHFWRITSEGLTIDVSKQETPPENVDSRLQGVLAGVNPWIAMEE